jgi:hypothetical protein
MADLWFFHFMFGAFSTAYISFVSQNISSEPSFFGLSIASVIPSL